MDSPITKPLQYKRVDTSTLNGLEEAEHMQEDGWKIIQSGLFSILFEKEK